MAKQTAPTYYVLGLNHQGVWFQSMDTPSAPLAKIRYVDLQTIERAAILTTHLKTTKMIAGRRASDAQKFIKFARGKGALKIAIGVPVEEINRTLRPDWDRPLIWDQARGASRVDGKIRPGSMTNSWTDKNGLILNTGLLKKQRRLASQQVALRKAAGLSDCARV